MTLKPVPLYESISDRDGQHRDAMKKDEKAFLIN